MQHVSAAAIHTGSPRTRRLTPLELALLASVGIAFIAAVIASTGASRPAHVPTTTLRVVQGDTMWEIASAHRIEGLTTAQTVSLIAELNGIGEGELAAGSSILVPSHLDAASSIAMR